MRISPIQKYPAKAILRNREKTSTAQQQKSDFVLDKIPVAFSALNINNSIRTTLNNISQESERAIDYSEALSKIIKEQNELYNKDFTTLAKKFAGIVATEKFKFIPPNERDSKSLQEQLDDYIVKFFPFVATASMLLTEDAVLYATEMKHRDFTSFVTDAYKFKLAAPETFLQTLLEKTNPKENCSCVFWSNHARALRKSLSDRTRHPNFWEMYDKNTPKIKLFEEQISVLKKDFTPESKKMIKVLQKHIKELRAEIAQAKSTSFLLDEDLIREADAKVKKILSAECKDPQNKIRAFQLIQMAERVNWREGLNDLKALVDVKSPADQQKLNQFLKSSITKFLSLSNKAMEGFEKLDIGSSPYLHKLVQQAAGVPRIKSDYDGVIFNDYMSSHNAHSFGDILETLLVLAAGELPLSIMLDKLPQNRETKYILQSRNINYDVWSGFDEERDVMRFDDGLVVRKIDMSNVKHSLFLGNQSDCCTRIGTGVRSVNAPLYIMNKFVQGIEILDGDEVIGNTMCYLMEANDEVKLVLDNVEVLEPYRHEPRVRLALLEFTKRFAQNLSKDYIPILAGFRNKIDFSLLGNSLGSYYTSNLAVLGSSGEYQVSLDSIGSAVYSYDKPFTATFFVLTNMLSKNWTPDHSIMQRNWADENAPEIVIEAQPVNPENLQNQDFLLLEADEDEPNLYLRVRN